MDASQLVYLRPNLVAEPLVNRWYAWSFLIPPATAALNFENHNLKLLESFATTPQVHVQALKRPQMRGGPFINHPAERAHEVRALLEETRQRLKPLRDLAAAIKQLNALLQSEASGSSLEPLYERVPDILQGYVELVYDLQHRPGFKVLERLLYDGPLYDETNQSLRLFLCDSDARPFVLSTPRLDDAESFWLEIPFRSKAIDALAEGRNSARPLGFYQDILGANDPGSIARFFTPEPPVRPQRFAGPGVRVRYLGHACVLVESPHVNLLFDPVVPYKHGKGPERCSFTDLPDHIDFVVITHNHQDHVVLETLLQLRHKIGTVVVPQNSPGHLADPSLKIMLGQLGFESVRAIDQLETVAFEGGKLTALPFLGEHGDLDVCSKAAHLVEMGAEKLLLAADSNNISPRMYDHLHRLVGDISTIFVGMECAGAPMSWLYGPLLMKPVIRRHDQSRRLDGSDAARVMSIVERLNPKRVYIYAMGAEPWLEFISSISYTDESPPIVESDRVLSECSQRGIVSERLFGYKEIPLAGA